MNKVKEVKNYSVKYEKSPYNTEFFKIRITFKQDDNVRFGDILEAVYNLPEKKRILAFESNQIEICVRRGLQLGYITKPQYEKYLLSRHNNASVKATMVISEN